MNQWQKTALFDPKKRTKALPKLKPINFDDSMLAQNKSLLMNDSIMKSQVMDQINTSKVEGLNLKPKGIPQRGKGLKSKFSKQLLNVNNLNLNKKRTDFG